MGKLKRKNVPKIPNERQLRFRRSPKLKQAVIRVGAAVAKELAEEERGRSANLERVLRMVVR